jgi:hypothetical protein
LRPTVLPSERAQFSALIDGILAEGDLSTISAKQIRKGLQAKLTFDISSKKVSASQFHFNIKFTTFAVSASGYEIRITNLVSMY